MHSKSPLDTFHKMCCDIQIPEAESRLELLNAWM